MTSELADEPLTEFELYNIASDPQEQHDLSDSEPETLRAIDILTRLARILSDFRDEADTGRDPLLPRVWMSCVTVS